jgi:hypothetical protein
MRSKLDLDLAVGAVDKILELPIDKPLAARSTWLELDKTMCQMLESVKFDGTHWRRLSKIMTRVRKSASQLMRSLNNARGAGRMRGDWLRLAERDLIAFKDNLVELREFLVGERDFLSFALLRKQLKDLSFIDPERLFKELRETQSISERTWVLLMTRPNAWKKALKNRELKEQLARISAWLLDLQEARRDPCQVRPEGIEENGV